MFACDIKETDKIFWIDTHTFFLIPDDEDRVYCFNTEFPYSIKSVYSPNILSFEVALDILDKHDSNSES